MQQRYLGLIVACWISLVAVSAAQHENRVRMAEGEYIAADGNLGIGHVETEIFHFRESWTLWRTPTGDYEVEGERSFESPEYFSHIHPFWIHLTKDFHVDEIKEFTRLRFIRDSGPLTCSMQADKLHCTSGAKDPVQSLDLDLEMEHPYTIMWPISAFSLGSLVRATKDRVGEKIPVQIVTLEEISEDLPLLTVTSEGSICYLGQDQTPFEAMGQRWTPKVYQLDSSPVRHLFIWTTPEGLVLAAQQSKDENSRLQLVSFRKFQDF